MDSAQLGHLATASIWSDGGTGHLPTLVRATVARLGTSLAVFSFVLVALCATRVANVGTETAKFRGKLRIATHESCGIPTDRSAISIQANAFGHFFHIVFAQTGVSAMLALLGALNAGFNACSKFVVCHDSHSFVMVGDFPSRFFPGRAKRMPPFVTRRLGFARGWIERGSVMRTFSCAAPEYF
jgi:hypothetical protein